MRLRNQVAHSVSVLPAITEVCWVHVADVGLLSGEPMAGQLHFLYAEGTLDQPDLRPETLFTWVAKASQDAGLQLGIVVEALASFVRATGAIAPPVAVYRVPGNQGVLTELPGPPA